ncbi:12829_t:CDS:2 [Gigaspora rosea]|nr:12829_t:CDS:2 [Gigaspora rosea]
MVNNLFTNQEAHIEGATRSQNHSKSAGESNQGPTAGKFILQTAAYTDDLTIGDLLDAWVLALRELIAKVLRKKSDTSPLLALNSNPVKLKAWSNEWKPYIKA